jgi:lauroyl/myristoyl acyltransferase
VLQSLFKDEYPRSWQRKVTRRYFMRIRCDKMFYTIMDRIPRAKLMNRIKLHGGEQLDKALAGGHGLYAALCHFGAHYVAGLMTALLGYKVTGVRDPKESHVRRYIQNKYRETFPEVAEMRVFHANSFPREIFRQFKENRIVASLQDVDRNRGDNVRTFPVRFFGETREFLTGPLQIAIRCRAPVIQGFVESRKNFYYGLIAKPLLPNPANLGDEDTVIAETMQRYADGIEQFARQHPDHLMNI